MEVSIVTVVVLIGCATFVYADFDRPGPEGKQKLIISYKKLQLKSMIGQYIMSERFIQIYSFYSST